jgi:hypothetical protein
MASSYKIERAFRLSHGPLPMARAEIARTLNTRPDVLDSLTSRQLAGVIDLLNDHWHRASAWTEAEVCAEGYVWDARTKKLRDLV